MIAAVTNPGVWITLIGLTVGLIVFGAYVAWEIRDERRNREVMRRAAARHKEEQGQ